MRLRLGSAAVLRRFKKSLLVDNRREVIANTQRVGFKPVDRSYQRWGRHVFNSLEIHLPTKHTKRHQNFRGEDRQIHVFWATGARIPFSDNGQSSRADSACSRMRRVSSEPASGIYESIGRRRKTTLFDLRMLLKSGGAPLHSKALRAKSDPIRGLNIELPQKVLTRECAFV
jgi:hypothetical protein